MTPFEKALKLGCTLQKKKNLYIFKTVKMHLPAALLPLYIHPCLLIQSVKCYSAHHSCKECFSQLPGPSFQLIKPSPFTELILMFTGKVVFFLHSST